MSSLRECRDKGTIQTMDAASVYRQSQEIQRNAFEPKVFCDQKGILSIEFMAPGMTIMFEVYCLKKFWR